MMNKNMNKTNEELKMIRLDDEELNQVIGGSSTAARVYGGTVCGYLGLIFLQIPGLILGALFGSKNQPDDSPEDENNKMQNAFLRNRILG